MPVPPPTDAPRPEAVRLLRGAVVFGAVAFAVVVGWVAWEAVQRPDVGASLYGKGRAYTGIFWAPFLAFCAAGLGFTTYIFRRALRRLEAGELHPKPKR